MGDGAMLILQAGAGNEARRYAIEGERLTIGRHEGADVVLDDREVSREHARIERDGVTFRLRDLGSKNGTLVNGTRVGQPVRLRDGDELTIAPRFRMVFVDSEATVPARPAERGVRIDPVTRRVAVSGTVLEPPLAPNQFMLLELLAGEPERVFTRDEIADACYPDARGGVSDQAIDGLIRRLRARLAEADPDGDYIVALRGHGFRLGG